MEQNLELTLALLSRTPAALDALLRGLPEAWTHANEGEKTWSPYDIVGHLIHGERTDWIPRAQRILQFGEAKPFEKFDRTAQERESRGKSLPELLEEFAKLRAENLEKLRGMKLRAADLERRGMHPALGPVTLGQLIASWPVHDMTHLHQLARILAHQYKDAVGPWVAYMGVLRCAAHGD